MYFLGAAAIATAVAVLASCNGEPIIPATGPIQLVLVGKDTFFIQDTPVNPGCHYQWTMKAIGGSGPGAELRGGRILRTSNTAPSGIPSDTVYRWDTLTIKPLFNTPFFFSGEQRTSGPYATVSTNLPSSKNRVEFDYIVAPDVTVRVVSQIYYCIRL